MSTDWHLDTDLTRRYAAGAVSPVLAASAEAHLVGCAQCRAQVADEVPTDRLDRVWADVLEQVQAPAATRVERALRRLGLGQATARLVAVTPSLTGAWLTGVVVVLALSLAGAYQGPTGIAVFMALAPVLPVAGVAFAFGPASDPSHEMVAATPHSTVHLLAVRTAVVVTSTLLPAGVAAALLPGSPWLSVAWLLPALALTVGTLALSTRVEPHVAALALAALWVALVVPGLAAHRDPLLVSQPIVQLGSLAALLTSALVLLAQRNDIPELLRRIA